MESTVDTRAARPGEKWSNRDKKNTKFKKYDMTPAERRPSPSPSSLFFRAWCVVQYFLVPPIRPPPPTPTKATRRSIKSGTPRATRSNCCGTYASSPPPRRSTFSGGLGTEAYLDPYTAKCNAELHAAKDKRPTDENHLAEGGEEEEVLRPPPTWLTVSNPSPYPEGKEGILLCLVQPDINILLDPIFSERASPLRHWGPKRRFPPPLAVEELPRIDFVLVSHNHYDHLDSQSIRAVYKRFPNVHFVLPKNMSTLLKPWGIPADAITELDWWEEAELLLWRGGEAKGVRLRIACTGCTPAQHWGLHAMGDRNKVLWCGWVVGYQLVENKSKHCTSPEPHWINGDGPLLLCGPLPPSTLTSLSGWGLGSRQDVRRRRRHRLSSRNALADAPALPPGGPLPQRCQTWIEIEVDASRRSSCTRPPHFWLVFASDGTARETGAVEIANGKRRV
eukprot:gene6797-4877_t